MEFIVTTKTTFTFNDEYIEGLKARGRTIEEMQKGLKQAFEELIANEITSPDGDFLGYSLSVEVESEEDKEESDVQS